MRPLPSLMPNPSDQLSTGQFDAPCGRDQEFDDATLLSLLMTRTMAHREIPDAVNALLEVFGSVGAVVAADPPELARVARLGATTITDLRLLRRLSIRLARTEACRRPDCHGHAIGSFGLGHSPMLADEFQRRRKQGAVMPGFEVRSTHPCTLSVHDRAFSPDSDQRSRVQQRNNDPGQAGFCLTVGHKPADVGTIVGLDRPVALQPIGE